MHQTLHTTYKFSPADQPCHDSCYWKIEFWNKIHYGKIRKGQKNWRRSVREGRAGETERRWSTNGGEGNQHPPGNDPNQPAISCV